jgi:hypothetical protein
MRGTAVFVVVGALVAGACGGTDWKAAHTPKPRSAAQLRAAAAAQRKAEIPYVNALVVKFSTAPKPPSLADSRCIAGAIVHGYGVKAFAAHGLTPNGLRNPRTSIDDLPTPTLPQVDAIGAAMQHCQLSHLGAALARGLGISDARTAACLATALARPQARRFLALSALGRHRVNLATAHTVVGLIAGCADLASLILRQSDLPADSAIRECVANALHQADAALKDYLALVISDADTDQIQEAKGEVLVAINECRPGAQTGFTVPPS